MHYCYFTMFQSCTNIINILIHVSILNWNIGEACKIACILIPYNAVFNLLFAYNALTWGAINSLGSSRYRRFPPANFEGIILLTRVSARSIWRPAISGLRDTNPQSLVSSDTMLHFLHTTAYWQISRWDKYENIFRRTYN